MAEDLEALLLKGFRYAYSLCGSKDVADDVLQEAWLAVLKADGPHVPPYLFRAIRTRFFDKLRREKRASLVLLTAEELEARADGELEAPPDMPDLIEAGKLREAMEKLRAEEREALYLNAVEEWTAQEIAVFWNCPRGTVLSHIRRARLKLAEELSDLREDRVSS